MTFESERQLACYGHEGTAQQIFGVGGEQLRYDLKSHMNEMPTTNKTESCQQHGTFESSGLNMLWLRSRSALLELAASAWNFAKLDMYGA